MISKFSIRNIAIFICGALLYGLITVFLYRAVFNSNSISGNKLSNSETSSGSGKHHHTNNNQHKQQEQTTINEIKNPFEYFLPTKDSIKMMSIPHKDSQPSLEEMKSTQSNQCGSTVGNTVPGRGKRSENFDWPNFSPSSFNIETDFRKWKNESIEYWKKVSSNLNGDLLNDEKLKMNEMGLTLNSHLKPKDGHLPIWLRVFKRRTPLDISLAAICKIDDISDTILYVTVDGGDFDPVFEELEKVTCVKVKIYFHPILSDLKNLGLGERNLDNSLTLNSHYVYGMYLLTQKLNYPYVITIEDDLEASPDFYRYHYSLYHLVYGKNATYYDSKKIFAIAAFAHGPHIDCNFIVAKLSNDYTSKCGMASVHQLIEENYFPGWGSGIAKEIFLEYWRDWRFNGYIYDYGLSQLRTGDSGSPRYTLVPCSTRVRTIANNGVNGGNSGGWGTQIHHFPSWNQKPSDRVYYVDRRDGVVHADVKGKIMYNKLV